MTFWGWFRDESVWPGRLILFAILGYLIWYGHEHDTWAGGAMWGTGWMVFYQQMDKSADSYRAWRDPMSKSLTPAEEAFDAMIADMERRENIELADLYAKRYGVIVCESCGEAGPTVKHRERTGGPDGNLCDECDREADLNGAEGPQF